MDSIHFLRKLEEAASPRPWPPEGLFDEEQQKANLAFIEAFRNMAPELLEELFVLRSYLEINNSLLSSPELVLLKRIRLEEAVVATEAKGKGVFYDWGDSKGDVKEASK